MNEKTLDRNFGDCEIHSISFMNGSTYLKFFDPVETTFFTLIFHSFGNLLFETNHFQNVITPSICTIPLMKPNAIRLHWRF